MWIVPIAEQTRSFLMACVVGVLLGGIYCLFRLIRANTGYQTAVTCVCDALFCLTETVIIICFIVRDCGSEPRMYLVAGFLIGAILFFEVVQNPLIRLIRWLRNRWYVPECGRRNQK